MTCRLLEVLDVELPGGTRQYKYEQLHFLNFYSVSEWVFDYSTANVMQNINNEM